MSSDTETTRILRSWLDEGVTELPDRVLDAVLDRVPATAQHRATWWPVRRLPAMNNTAKLAVGALAVVLVALLGIQFLVPRADLGGPDLPDPPDSFLSAPSPTPRALPPSGALDPGTYRVSRPDWTPVPFSITVPDGWSTDSNGFIRKHEGEQQELMLTPWMVTHIYTDACQWNGSLVEVGETTQEMAAALAEQGAREVSGPGDLTLGGYPAIRIELSVPTGLDVASCDDGEMRSWPSSATDETTGWVPRPGQTDVIYLIDVDGARLLIGTTSGPEASDEDLTELEGVIESIRFAPDPPEN